MLKFSRFIVKYRYWFMGVFLALFVGGLFCMGLVKVNYDFTEYLPPDSETRISLDLMEDTFGDIGTVQIMAKNVTEQEAAQIYALISGTENVRGVNFDAADPDYYQGGNALYQVFFNTGNASQETVDTVAVLRESLGAYELAVNGAALDTMYIQEAIAGEMPMILGIAFAIVLVILLLTSNSWFEPGDFSADRAGGDRPQYGHELLAGHDFLYQSYHLRDPAACARDGLFHHFAAPLQRGVQAL